jgi:hypothetical protein
MSLDRSRFGMLQRDCIRLGAFLQDGCKASQVDCPSASATFDLD